MSHLDPVTHAAQHYGAIERRDDSIDKEEDALICAFMRACQRGDANSIATFAPLVTDWDSISPRPIAFSTDTPKRLQRLHEVMAASFDYSKGPDLSQVFQLLLNVAYGGVVLADAPRQARELLAQAASTWAHYNVEG
jgi:hypothetical protein